jgi:uncharacterized repeat protein (TIGR03847 family)
MSTNLGSVDIIGAEAVGQPGQRRFRLFALAGARSLLLWMEKEQLNTLSLALDRVIAQITDGVVLRTIAQTTPLPQAEGLPANFPRRPSVEFQVGQIRIGYDEQNNLLALIASPIEVMLEPGQEPRAVIRDDESVSFLFTLRQSQQLTQTISALVTSGRPVCPLCNTPLDGSPHACIRQNGHREVAQDLEEDEDIDDLEDE